MSLKSSPNECRELSARIDETQVPRFLVEESAGWILRCRKSELLRRAVSAVSARLWQAQRGVKTDLNILAYHRIVPVEAGRPAPSWNVTPQRFRQQLDGLMQLGYSFSSLREVLTRRIEGDASAAPRVVVTFDDGYQNNFTHAWPILQELGVPATIFLSTAYVGSPEPFPFEAWGIREAHRSPSNVWQPLTWQQCVRMRDEGLVDFGTHTHTHQDFRGRPRRFAADLRKSVCWLRNTLGVRWIPLAFPYGFHDDALIGAAKNGRVVCALNAQPESILPTSDPFTWGRFWPSEWDTAQSLAAKFAGIYRWAGCIYSRRARQELMPC